MAYEDPQSQNPDIDIAASSDQANDTIEATHLVNGLTESPQNGQLHQAINYFGDSQNPQ